MDWGAGNEISFPSPLPNPHFPFLNSGPPHDLFHMFSLTAEAIDGGAPVRIPNGNPHGNLIGFGDSRISADHIGEEDRHRKKTAAQIFGGCEKSKILGQQAGIKNRISAQVSIHVYIDRLRGSEKPEHVQPVFFSSFPVIPSNSQRYK